MEEKNLSTKIMGDIITHMKYAKYLPELHRRETYEEIVTRNKEMHLRKFPELKDEIEEAYELVYEKKIWPSGRSAQFAGTAIEMSPVRIYNCSALAITDIKAFSEIMYLLLMGTGTGFSIQKHHVRQLPPLKGVSKPIGRQHKRRFLIQDSIVGWADAVRELMESHFYGEREIDFDFRDIRKKGAPLKTSGGHAPGPEPLRICLLEIASVLENAVDTRGSGTKLTTLEAYDIICHLADAVLCGGIRRSATIALFSLDDEDMLTCKYGDWWEKNPQRGRANNSVVVDRNLITKDVFDSLWKKVQASGSGEPGIFFTNDIELLTNPCFTGDMQLLTSNGYKRFDSLSDSEVNIVDATGNSVLGKVWCSGIKDTVRLRLSDGSFITCTPDHKFYVVNDDTWVEAKNTLKKRLSVDTSYRYLRDTTYERYGFIQGDGNLTRLNSSTHVGMEVNIGAKDDDILELFGVCRENNERSFYLRGHNEPMKKAGFCAAVLPERLFPMDFYNSIDDKASFLRGLYSANGSVIKEHRVAFKTTCKALANDLLYVLNRDFGIDGYITTNKAKNISFANGDYTCKESYDVNISKFSGVLSFLKNIGFIQHYKMTELINLVNCKAPMVLSISENGTQNVYDFTVPTTHSGWVKGTGDIGVRAHNCAEVSLQSFSFCNLSTINATSIVDQEDFNLRAKMASRIATLQAAYTDFYYLRKEWRENAEDEALIGVSITGIADRNFLSLNIEEASNEVMKENEEFASKLGINKAARTTVVKPEGSSSLMLGTSSGVHAWYAQYYWRRISVGKDEPIYAYLRDNHPELLEDDYFKPTTMAKIKIPMKAPEGAMLRYESALDTLERVKRMNLEWIQPGHREGANFNNTSCTISVKPDEWSEVGEWMWNNRDSYTGIAVLPYDGGTYTQSPFEECTKEEYEEAVKYLSDIDLTAVYEDIDSTDRQGEVACGGGACEIT